MIQQAPLVVGMSRIKNESRWIERVVKSFLPLCSKILIFDDHSTDNTAAICEGLGCQVYRSPFEVFDERQDKNFLLQKVYESLPDPNAARGWARSPYWAICFDGDEELEPAGIDIIRQAIADTIAKSYSLRVKYLWNDERHVRVDGVYRNFRRPSLFRLINAAFTFKTTPWAGNMHCSSIPQEMIGGFQPCEAALLHWGYIDAELRKRKHEWYTRIDPDNWAEDCYRHITQGDPGGVPEGVHLKHAGPLQLMER